MLLLRVEAVELKTAKKLKMELQIQGMSEAQVREARNAVGRKSVSE